MTVYFYIFFFNLILFSHKNKTKQTILFAFLGMNSEETVGSEEMIEKRNSILNTAPKKKSILLINPKPKYISRVSLIMDGPLETKFESGKLRLKKNSPYVVEALKRLGYDEEEFKKK